MYRAGMYLSRCCYDKPWRCPGWAGGGMHYAAVQRCDGGQLDIYADPSMKKSAHWRFGRCSRCDVRALPFVTRWVDPAWLAWVCRRMVDRFRDR